MFLYARVIALCLAACALAARAHAWENTWRREGRLRPLCMHEACQYVRTENDSSTRYYDDVYLVNGKELRIYARYGKLQAYCVDLALDDPAWPRFKNPHGFQEVSISGCAPLNTSYAAALKRMNVDIEYDELSLWKIPETIAQTAFADLPKSIVKLWLSTNGGLIELDPRWLDSLFNLRTLVLNHVHCNRLPIDLDVLKLWNTKIEVLPPEAFYVYSLAISEPRLKTIVGSSRRLQRLKLDRVPALKTLVLEQAQPQVLRNGLLARCYQLKVLVLRKFETRNVTRRLLRGATSLSRFSYTDGELTDLSRTFFSYTTMLEFIDLSRNKLQTVKRMLFSGLPFLRELYLEDNYLGIPDLRAALAPLTALLTLRLSGNLIGTMCPDGATSLLAPLQQLQELTLARTAAPQICADWLRELRTLKYLDLRGNALTRLSCSDFRAEGVTTIVDVVGNPFEQLECSPDDEELAANLSSTPISQVTLVVRRALKCDCRCPFVNCIEKTQNRDQLDRLSYE